MKRLLRFYLESNQYLLETVSPAHKILKLHEEPNLIKDTYSIDLPSISTHLSARSEDFTIKPKPAKDIKNEEYLVDDYNSKAEITDYNYDEVKAYLQHDAPSEQINSNPNHSSEGADAVFKVKNNSPRFKPESYTTERTLSRNKFSLHPHSYRKDKSEISREHQNDNFLNDQESTVFESQSAKSYEEIKEELQKNASRALIVEVPLNQTNFLNFGTSSTEQLKVKTLL